MGNVTFGIPQELTIPLRKAINAKVFIETGTYKGRTALWASDIFDTVYTIEFSQERYLKTLANITENHKDKNNIKMTQGNSKVVLFDILAVTNEPVIFWLDAHGLGKLEENMTQEDEIPLMQELEIILNWQERTGNECCILIDDARLFINPPPVDKGYHPEFWPKLSEIENKLKDFYVCVSKDVIVAVPKSLSDIVDEWALK